MSAPAINTIIETTTIGSSPSCCHVIPNFAAREQVVIQVDIYRDSAAQDITSDTVRIKVGSVITKNADVVTDGASGRATFTLTPTDTAITPGRYNVQVVWFIGWNGTGSEPTTEQIMLYSGKLKVKARL